MCGMRRFPLHRLPRRHRPPLAMGLAVAVLCLVVETALGAAVSGFAPIQSVGVLYLVGLLVIASVWGLVPGLLMAVSSIAVFDYFLIPPAWSLRLIRREDLAMLGIFMSLALLACALAWASRLLSVEVEAREEAVLSAELARLLLRAPELGTALPAAARRLDQALDISGASIEPGAIPSDDEHVVFRMHGDDVLATLRVPTGLPRPLMRRLRERVVPSLEVLLDAARERERVADALRESRDELGRVANEQTALRRLATLIAHGAPPTEVFEAVACEMGRLLGARHTLVARYEPVATAVTVGCWNSPDDIDATMPLGSHWTLERGTVSELVFRTRAPGRVSAYVSNGSLVARLRARGIVSSVGCPIVVGRSLWGVAIASSSTAEPLPADTERRMLEFTELAAAAIANAQGNADLKASRARVVAAADEARRRIERDLHDGTQQRLVSLGLELRSVEDAIPPEMEELRQQLADTTKSLEGAVIDLQELSRGLHPAVLAKGGLPPALTVLARRSVVPVELDVTLRGRLPQQLEVTVYYVVCEALTNATKHAFASVVHVSLSAGERVIRLSIRDDGVGGADPGCGSGLVGITDRVEALGGNISIMSPAQGGTSLLVELPIDG
jgi:signal transduction histidine kinase